jgi:serine/threonine protein kinase
MPPNARIPPAAAARRAPAVRASGGQPSNTVRHGGGHGIGDDDDDDASGNGLLSSIVGLIEPPTLANVKDGSAGAFMIPGLSAAAEFKVDVDRLTNEYRFLSLSFESATTRRRSTITNTSSVPSSWDGSDRNNSTTSFRSSSTTPLPADDPAYAHLERMSRDELMQYAVRLTAVVSAFVSRERVNQRRADDLLNASSDDDAPPADGRLSTLSDGPLQLTHSVRSMVMPPVQHTSQINRGTDFEGNKMINDYSIIAELGRGAYGKVKLAVNNTTNETCAIKIMKKSVLKRGTGEAVVRREIAVMKKLRHKNIVPLIEVLDNDDAEKVYLVMKYVDNGTMVHVRGDLTCNPLPLPTATRYLRQIVSGLSYLHNHGVIHRDLKPDNIMLDTKGVVYLTDFGVSDIVASASAGISGTEGTPIFLAPELLNAPGDDAARISGPPVDVWALGVTFYFAVFGKAPFEGRTWTEIANSVTTKSPDFPADADKNWISVLSQLLEKDPTKRIKLHKLKRHKLFDGLTDDDSFGRSVTNPLAHSTTSTPDDEEPPPLHIVVSEEELHGSMRHLRQPLDEDNNVFRSMSMNVKKRVGKFLDSIRTKVATQRLATLGLGDILSEDDIDDATLSGGVTPQGSVKRAAPDFTPRSQALHDAFGAGSTIGPAPDLFEKKKNPGKPTANEGVQQHGTKATAAGSGSRAPRGAASGPKDGRHKDSDEDEHRTAQRMPTPPVGSGHGNPRRGHEASKPAAAPVAQAESTSSKQPRSKAQPRGGDSPRGPASKTSSTTELPETYRTAGGTTHTARPSKANEATLPRPISTPRLPAIAGAKPVAGPASSRRR